MKKKYREEIYMENGIEHHKIIPDDDFTLFRYRSDNDYNLKALIRHEFWVTRPDAFNDPYDTSFVVDTKKLIDYLLTVIDNDLIIEYGITKNIKSKNKRYIAKKWIEEIYHSNSDFFKKIFLIASFSENINNEVMWAHYANNGKGFGVEYYYKDIRSLKNIHCQSVSELSKAYINQFEGFRDIFGDIENQNFEQYDAYKVNYKNSKYDATDLIRNAIDVTASLISEPNYSMLDVIKKYHDKSINLFTYDKQKIISDTIVFTKKKNWQYEQEWRLLLPNLLIDISKMDVQHIDIGLIFKPKAIYIGEFCELPTKVILYNHCYTNGIELYQMYSELKNKSYKLKKKQIQKKEMLDLLNDVK